MLYFGAERVFNATSWKLIHPRPVNVWTDLLRLTY